MAFHDPLPAAPGRRTVHLGRGWCAVFLELPSGLPFAVGFFYRSRVVEVADEPEEVQWLARSLLPDAGAVRHAQPRTANRRGSGTVAPIAEARTSP
jgi:hypothetical protein